MTPERVSAVDFSAFLGVDSFTILMRTQKHYSKADSLLAPFTRNVSRS